MQKIFAHVNSPGFHNFVAGCDVAHCTGYVSNAAIVEINFPQLLTDYIAVWCLANKSDMDSNPPRKGTVHHSLYSWSTVPFRVGFTVPTTNSCVLVICSLHKE